MVRFGNGQWVYNDPSYINFVKTSNSDGSPIGVAYIQGMNVNLRSEFINYICSYPSIKSSRILFSIYK